MTTRFQVIAALCLAGALLACTPAPGAAGPGVATSSSPSPTSGVGVGMVAYHGQVQGYLAEPPATATKPHGVVMIHEWWGLNDQIKAQADTLAKEGYMVLAVDLFNGKVAKTPDEARAQTGSLDASAATANLKSAVAYLRARPNVQKVASLGWCFGGGWSLRLVQAQPDLAAGVIYYGSLESDPAKLKGLPPILGIFGETDQNPSPTHVADFKKALEGAGVPHEIHSYAGAGHAFANPTGGDRYKPEAAADAWTKTLAFLKKHVN